MRNLVGPTVLMVLASLVGVASCASAHGSRADRLCRATLHRAVAGSSSTTVGDVRLLSGGPAGAHIVPDALPGAPASAYAAWCWTRGNRSLTAYAVTSGFGARQVASYDGLLPNTPTPKGAPGHQVGPLMGVYCPDDRRHAVRIPLGMPALVLTVTLAFSGAACDGGKNAGNAPARSTTTIPRRDPRQRYSIDGTVLENRDHGPELCAGLILQSLPPICGGPTVVGWDWTKVTARAVSGVRWGEFHLVGTFDGTRFTPTEAAAPALPLGTPGGSPRWPTPNFRTECAPPAGGWAVTNPSRIANADYQAMSLAAHGAPDFAAMWVDTTSSTNGSANQRVEQVYDIAFTGDLDHHRAQLQQLWGGPICVVQRPHTDAQLQRISETLNQDGGRGSALWLLSAVPLDVESVVWATVMVADRLAQSIVDQRFGPGIVRLTGVLQPVP